jgi:hypothetical protein
MWIYDMQDNKERPKPLKYPDLPQVDERVRVFVMEGNEPVYNLDKAEDPKVSLLLFPMRPFSPSSLND